MVHIANPGLKAQFRPGADIFTLYVDPVPGHREPASAVVKTDLDLGIVSALGIYSTGAFAIDEIRVGTTYADVTPKAHKTSRTDDEWRHEESCRGTDRDKDRR